MKRFFRVSAVMALLLTAACVTVNIYFPAAEIQKDAERVVKQAYGIEVEEGEAPGEGSWLRPDILELFGPSIAHAQDYVNLSNAATRGLESDVTATTQALAPYFSAGNVGIDASGFAALRDKSGLDMKQVGQVNRLVAADRKLKTALYQEKAKAAGTPDKVADVQGIFAQLWQRHVAAGTWIQTGSGWSQK